MTLYLIYKNAKKVTKEVKLEVTEIVADDKELKLSEEILKDQIIDVVKLSAIVCSEIIPMVTGNELKNEINLPQLNVIINEDMMIKPKAIIEAS